MRNTAALLTLLLASSLSAAPSWIETRSGPFVVYSDAGNDSARAALYELEQFRFLFAEALGARELRSSWPITVVVRKSKTPPTPHLGFSRDGWLSPWPANSRPPAEWFERLALILLDDNLKGRMPGDLEPALATLYSTLEIQSGKVTLGTPPAASKRSRHWAMLQFLLTNPITTTRTRAFTSNLAQGADEGTAFRNAFERPIASFTAELDAYLAAGQFKTISLPARPLVPERAFSIIPMLASRLRALPGDELLAAGAPPAQVRAAYQSGLNERPGPLLWEGLGLALLAENQPADAKKAFEQMAADAENSGPRGLLELGLLERAAVKNPLWAEPYARSAAKEPGPVRKTYFLKKAVELAPRRPDFWKDLAQAQFDQRLYADAEKSWRTAERVARDDAERQALATGREAFVQARYDAEAAERARAKKEDQDAIERVRQAQLESIRKAEAAANSGSTVDTKKVEKWWDGPPAVSFEGTLEQVACQGRKARLMARSTDGKPAVFLVNEPDKVAILGPGPAQVQLSCGPQRPPRRVKIEYVAKPGAPGEVVTVEFR